MWKMAEEITIVLARIVGSNSIVNKEGVHRMMTVAVVTTAVIVHLRMMIQMITVMIQMPICLMMTQTWRRKIKSSSRRESSRIKCSKTTWCLTMTKSLKPIMMVKAVTKAVEGVWAMMTTSCCLITTTWRWMRYLTLTILSKMWR